MKNLLLSILLLSFASASTAQIIVRGVSPSSIAVNYEFEWADPNDGTWATPDFNIPNTNVQAPLMFADDGTIGINPQGNPLSAEACNGPLINDMTGHIAIIYRNTCEFGYKALQAQNAGAVGVIIINRDPEVIGMNGAAEGLNVTIPTVMLSSVDGATLTNEMANGEVVMFMGNKQNLFANDVGSYELNVFGPKYGSLPLEMANNGSDIEFGINAFNIGSVDHTINVNVLVTGPNGETVYNETVSDYVLSGDTLNIINGGLLEFPALSQSSWVEGDYTITYAIYIPGQIDEDSSDNVFVRYFSITQNQFARVSQSNGSIRFDRFVPVSYAYQEYQSCIQFQDTFPNISALNAVRIPVNGVDSLLLDGTQIEFILYEHNDELNY